MKTGPYRRNRFRNLGAFQDHLCFFCDKPLAYTGSNPNGGSMASFDHYISRYRGGSGKKENTVIAHRQCNSHKGHEPSPEFDEKLRELNRKRGYGDEDGVVEDHLVYRRLTPDEFSADFPSLLYLCDLVNEVEGVEGDRLRRTVTKRLKDHILLLKGLEVISSSGLRLEAIQAIREKRSAVETPLTNRTMATLLDNVRTTMTKRHSERLGRKQKNARTKPGVSLENNDEKNDHHHTNGDPSLTGSAH